jgi:hypothetical protein
MILRIGWVDALTRYAYTAFDLGLTALAAVASVIITIRIWRLAVRPETNLPIWQQ